MTKIINRRAFGKTALAAGLGSTFLINSHESTAKSRAGIDQKNALQNNIALNAYSFNAPLRNEEMDLFGLLDYSADIGFDGVDLTGYYFPGYPAPPQDEYIYRIKKKAFELGLHICGTGVRNDFTIPDPAIRAKEKELVKNWILVAHKLGAPALRTFSGKKTPEGYSREETTSWMVEDYLECAEFGKKHGVVIEIQNHNDFLKTAEEVSSLMEAINSDWVGLMLDVGSYRTSDPYEEIAATIDYAVSWQIKEDVFVRQNRTPVDLDRLKQIIQASSYKGYLPVETLGPGDAKTKVKDFYDKVNNVFYRS